MRLAAAPSVSALQSFATSESPHLSSTSQKEQRFSDLFGKDENNFHWHHSLQVQFILVLCLLVMCLLMISIATFFHCKAWKLAKNKKSAGSSSNPEEGSAVPPPPPSPNRRCSGMPLLPPEEADWVPSLPPPFAAAANLSLLPSSPPWILSSSPPSSSLPASSPPTLLRAPSAPPSVPATRVRNNLAFLLEVGCMFSFRNLLLATLVTHEVIQNLAPFHVQCDS